MFLISFCSKEKMAQVAEELTLDPPKKKSSKKPVGVPVVRKPKVDVPKEEVLDPEQFEDLAPPKKPTQKRPKATTPSIISQPNSQKYEIDQYDYKNSIEWHDNDVPIPPPPQDNTSIIDKNKWRASTTDEYSSIPLSLFTCTSHAGRGLFLPATVVVAEDEDVAREILDKKLYDAKLDTSKQFPYTLVKIDTREAKAYVLSGARAYEKSPGSSGKLCDGELSVYATTTHDSEPCIPPASIVVASSQEEATVLLDAKLASVECKTSKQVSYVLEDISLYIPLAYMFSDGAELKQW